MKLSMTTWIDNFFWRGRNRNQTKQKHLCMPNWCDCFNFIESICQNMRTHKNITNFKQFFRSLKIIKKNNFICLSFRLFFTFLHCKNVFVSFSIINRLRHIIGQTNGTTTHCWRWRRWIWIISLASLHSHWIVQVNESRLHMRHKSGLRNSCSRNTNCERFLKNIHKTQSYHYHTQSRMISIVWVFFFHD